MKITVDFVNLCKYHDFNDRQTLKTRAHTQNIQLDSHRSSYKVSLSAVLIMYFSLLFLYKLIPDVAVEKK